MGSMRKTGVTTNTPKRVLFGAGVFYKDMKYDNDSNSWKGTPLGATKGGGTLTVTPNIVEIAPDGVPVKVKGLAVKNGETCTLQVNLLELTEDIIKLAVLGKTEEGSTGNYDKIVSKSSIEEGDYVKDLAFVGKLLDGRDVVCIIPYALCNSGLPVQGQDGQEAAIAYTFEEHIDISDTGDMDHLAYEIYFEKESA